MECQESGNMDVKSCQERAQIEALKVLCTAVFQEGKRCNISLQELFESLLGVLYEFAECNGLQPPVDSDESSSREEKDVIEIQ